MYRDMEDMIKDFVIYEKKEIAVRLLELNVLSNEKIAECVGLDVEIVNALATPKNLFFLCKWNRKK